MTTTETTPNATPEIPPLTSPRLRAWYPTLIIIALIAAFFCLTIIAVMLINHYHSITSNPLLDEQYQQLRQIVINTNDNSARDELRRIDLDIRRRYFRDQALNTRGSYLLIVGSIVLLISARLAAQSRRKLPQPKLTSDDTLTTLTQTTMRRARWSIITITIIATASALALAITAQDPLNITPTLAPQLKQGHPTWPRLRGPHGSGYITTTTNDIPTTWNIETGHNILWDTQIPLASMNSPIIVGNHILISAANNQTREIYSFNTDTGNLQWTTPIPRSPMPLPEVTPDTGYAAATMTTDSRRIFAIFANGDVVALDLAGNQLWLRPLGPLQNNYGHASSLLTHENLLIIQLDHAYIEDNKSKLIALNTATGKTVYSIPRPVDSSWATPIIADTPIGPQLITVAEPYVIAYNPADGTELWRSKSVKGELAPSPIYHNSIVYVISPDLELKAIKTTGSADVTDTHTIWTAYDGVPDITTPVTNGKLLWLLSTWGTLTCYDITDGSIVYEHDLADDIPPDSDAEFNASPIIINNLLYITSVRGVTLVINTTPQYQLIATSNLFDDIHATPAISPSRIYYRGDNYLYCITNTTNNPDSVTNTTTTSNTQQP